MKTKIEEGGGREEEKKKNYSSSISSAACAHKLNITKNCIYWVSEENWTPNKYLQDHHSSIWALNSKVQTNYTSQLLLHHQPNLTKHRKGL